MPVMKECIIHIKKENTKVQEATAQADKLELQLGSKLEHKKRTVSVLGYVKITSEIEMQEHQQIHMEKQHCFKMKARDNGKQVTKNIIR